MEATQMNRRHTGVKAGLFCLVLWVMMLCSTAFAAQEPDWNDPDYVKMVNQKRTAQEELAANRAASQDANPYTGVVYTHADVFQNCDIIMGIDVSKWEESIDWTKVKADGIDFAILRVGYRGLSDGSLNPDGWYETYVKGARAAGVKIGAYFFSQATTVAEAKEEANYMLKLMGGAAMDYPVVFDFEAPAESRLAEAKLTASQATKICQAFCNIVKKAGYTPMVYANKTDLTNNLKASTLSAQYKIWLARYNTYAGYDGEYSFWQYTESGKVDGINTAVDCNFYYKPGKSEPESTEGETEETPAEPEITVAAVTGAKAKAASGTKIKVSYSGVSGAAGYEIWRSTSYGGTYKRIKTLTGTSYTNSGLAEGREYYYKVRAYAKNGSEKVYGDFSGPFYTYTAFPSSCKVKTTLASNLREQAGTEYKSLAVIPAGTACTLKATTRSVGNVVWYRVKVTLKGKSYTGYLSSNCATVRVKKVTSLKAKSTASTSITLSWAGQSGITGYQIYRASARNGKYKKVATVKAGTTTWKNTGLTKYCEYYYKVRAYSKVNGKVTYGSWSAITTLGTKKTSFKVKTKTALTLRQYAGTSYKKLTVLPRNKALKVTYRTKDKQGKWWYHVTVTVNKKKYIGYVSASYVKKS